MTKILNGKNIAVGYNGKMFTFSERLKELRVERSLTQRQLAQAVGLSQTAITQWENKLREPSASVIITLSRFFNVTTDYLLGEEDN